MSFRAKFRVSEVRAFEYGGEQIHAYPVTSGSPEDNSFAEATPAGRLELTITNPALVRTIKPGATFYADFTPVD